MIFYRGDEREIDFRKVKTAGGLFALSLGTGNDPSRETKSPDALKVMDGRIASDVPIPERRTVAWERSDRPPLTFSVLIVSFGTSGRRRQGAAWLGRTNLWKAPNQRTYDWLQPRGLSVAQGCHKSLASPLPEAQEPAYLLSMQILKEKSCNVLADRYTYIAYG